MPWAVEARAALWLFQPERDWDDQLRPDRRIGEGLYSLDGFDHGLVKHIATGTFCDPYVFRGSIFHHNERDGYRTFPTHPLRERRILQVLEDQVPDIGKMAFHVLSFQAALSIAHAVACAVTRAGAITCSNARAGCARPGCGASPFGGSSASRR